MGKTEFLDKLRLALNGRLQAREVSDNLAYYEDYINTQIRLGHSEEEVISGLGDPRLIAKTIIGTSAAGQNISEEWEESGFEEDAWEEKRRRRLMRILRLPSWVWLLIAFLVVALVLGAIFSLLSFLVPFILPILVIMFLVKLFRDWLN